MVVVRIEMIPLDNYDLSRNQGYATVELTPITDDPNTWPHKIILPAQMTKGQPILSRKQDVDPGIYPVYAGIKLANYCFFELLFDTVIYDDVANKRLFSTQFSLPVYENVRTQQLGQLEVSPPSGNVTLTLTVGSNGKVVVVLPDRSETRTPGTYTYTIQSGTWVTLEATPNTGYYFDGYYEAGSRVSGSTKLNIQILENRSIEAKFKASSTPPSGYYILTYNVGPNGTLYIDGEPYRDTSGQKVYPAGTQVSIRAEPDQGYEIYTIKIDGVPEPTAPSSYKTTITMNANYAIDASFTKAGTTATTTDVGEMIRRMMETMMPPMIQMMGMMMMVNMIAGIVSALAGALAG